MADFEMTCAGIWLRELAKLDLKEEVVEEKEDSKTITRYTPLGVVGAIVPWNYPVWLACGKIAPYVELHTLSKFINIGILTKYLQCYRYW